MSPRVRPVIGAAVMTTAIALAGVGCGGDNESGAEVSAAAPKGEPIVVAQTAPYTGPVGLPEAREGARVAVAAINARGGVDGRPLEIEFCDDKLDPNEAASCGRRFAEDDRIVATVGNPNLMGQFYEPAAEKAGLPDIAPYPLTPAHYTSRVAFPITGGVYGVYAGSTTLALRGGARRVAVIYNDLPSAPLFLGGIQDVLEERGLKTVAEVPVSVETTDVGPAVARVAAAKPDAVIVAFAEPLLSRVIQSFRQTGRTTPLYTGSADLDQQAVDTLGPAAEGLVGAGVMPPAATKQAVPAVKDFNAEMDRYADGEPKRTAITMNAWASVRLLADVAAGLDRVDRESVLTALNRLDAYDTGGLTPPIDFTSPGPQGKPRLFNAAVVELSLRDGNYDFDGRFVDPFGG